MILVLGGTAEGRALATALVDTGLPVVSSLAGRLSSPRLPPGKVRVGGFGGVDGLVNYLAQEQISAVIDTTHPFAGRMTANAVAACTRVAVPLLIVQRPPWTPESGDRWTGVADLDDAALALSRRPAESNVLLTTGRQGVGAFRQLPQRFWVRAVEAPETAELPVRHQLILDRGPFSVSDERELLQKLAIDMLVTKNSGGRLTAAKLTAARELDVEVIIVARPSRPANVPAVDDVEAAIAWATTFEHVHASPNG